MQQAVVLEGHSTHLKNTARKVELLIMQTLEDSEIRYRCLFEAARSEQKQKDRHDDLLREGSVNDEQEPFAIT